MKKRLPTDHIITIINQKGGVGKTSSCTLMATLLGLAGYQCLVIDNDSQANTTATLLPDIASVTKSIVDIFRMNTPTAEEVAACIYHTPYQGVNLIPSRPEHQRTDDYLYSLLGRKAIHKLLKRAIKQVEEHYDYILIDTHPDLGGSVQNALCCSDYVLIPVKPDGYSYQGVTPIINQVLDIASDEDLNPDLELLGVFFDLCRAQKCRVPQILLLLPEYIWGRFYPRERPSGPLCICRMQFLNPTTIPARIIGLPGWRFLEGNLRLYRTDEIYGDHRR